MLLRSLRSLPALPIEVKGHILRFCDPQTLSRTSQVSLAFLELSGPILYEDIHITGDAKQLGKLMRSSDIATTIASFVSLEQIRTFTYTPQEPPEDEREDDSWKFCPVPCDLDRGLSADVLRLDTFTLDVSQWSTHPCWDVSLPVLFRSFNPTRALFIGAPPLESFALDSVRLTGTELWTELRCLHFIKSRPAHRFLWFTTHLSTGRSVPLDIDYDLRRSYVPDDPARMTVDLKFVRKDLGNDPHCPEDVLFGHVQVWVATEEQFSLAKDILVGCKVVKLTIAIKSSAASSP